jgi:hypothetical protein
MIKYRSIHDSNSSLKPYINLHIINFIHNVFMSFTHMYGDVLAFDYYLMVYLRYIDILADENTPINLLGDSGKF